MDILDSIRSRGQRRKMEEFRDRILLQMKDAGADEETLKLASGMRGKDPASLMAAMDKAVDIVSKIRNQTPEGQERTFGSTIAGRIIRDSQSPGGIERLQTENPFGVKASKEGVSVDIPASPEAMQKEAEATAYKEAASQSAKAAELAERDVFRAGAAVDTAFDQAISFGEKQMENYGLRPGQLFGLVDKATPSEWNEFKDAFTGATREGASLIARQLIPGVRAANITKLFEKSISTLGKTMESNAVNSGASMGNAFANALSQNIRVETEDGKKINIQDATIDKVTGRPISKLGFKEKTRAINDLKREFAKELERDLMERTYKRNPSLLQPSTVAKMVLEFPSFTSEEEGQKALPPGRLFKVGDDVYEAE